MSPFFFAGRLKFMSEIIFETKRLYAKKLTVNSIPDLKKMLQDPRVTLMKGLLLMKWLKHGLIKCYGATMNMALP